MATEKISIVITCHGQALDLPIILHCIDQQRVNIDGVHSTDDHGVHWNLGDYTRHPKEIIVVCDGKYEGDQFFDDHGNRDLGEAYADLLIEVPHEGKVGHHTRAPGIEKATGDWIVLTNSDNYFVAGWLDRLVTNIEPDIGLIYWDCVNNLWRWTANGGGTKFPGCRLKRGHIDLTCVAVRAEISKRVGFPWRDYEADYEYISACARGCDLAGLKIKYLPEILAVHN